jgi:hypothetical protein
MIDTKKVRVRDKVRVALSVALCSGIHVKVSSGYALDVFEYVRSHAQTKPLKLEIELKDQNFL